MTTLPQTAPVRLQRMLPTNGAIQPGGGSLGFSQPPVTSAMTPSDVLRVIRTNLWLVLSVLVVSILGGYMLNMWLAAKHSRYTSSGLVNVKNERINPMDSGVNVNASTTNLEVEQITQANLLRHERLLSSILETSDPIRDTEWFKQFVFYKNGEKKVDAEAAKADLLDHLEVLPIPQSRLIRVSMSWSVPKDCQTIVTEVVAQHINNVRQDDNTRLIDAAHGLESLKQNYESQIREINSRMLRLSTDLGAEGVGIGSQGNSKQFELSALIQEELRGEAIYSAAVAKLSTFDEQMRTSSAPELEEALQRNPLYTDYRRQVDELMLAYQDVVSQTGPAHVKAIALKHRLDAMQEKLSDTENDIKSRTAELIRANLVNDQIAAESAVKRINKRMGDLRSEIAGLAKKGNDYDRLEKDLANVRTQLDHVKDQQDRIGYIMGNDQNKWSRVDWAQLPDLPDHPTFPKLPVTMTLSVLSGLALSLGIAFLREMMDTTVRTPRDLARIGNLPMLGMIPHEADDPQAAGSRLPLAIFEAPHSIIAEQFRQVRTRLQHTASLDTTRSILVTGCSPEDGKTTVACNLAAGLALNGRRILLVDANFRRPNLHNIFAPSTDIGFGDTLNDLDLFTQAVQETEVPNLSVVIAGAKPSNPTELLESQLLVDFIERALEEYDHVIFDSGPLLMVSDSIALAPRVDGVITVVRARGNSRGMLTRMRDELRRLKAEHLGVVLNAVRVHGGGYYNSMIKNYYAYQAG